MKNWDDLSFEEKDNMDMGWELVKNAFAYLSFVTYWAFLAIIFVVG